MIEGRETYVSPIDGSSLIYAEELALRPDIITDAVALIAAANANGAENDRLRIIELGCGAAPFLTLITKRLRKDITLDLIALDLSEGALEFAKTNLERTLKARRNQHDGLRVVNASWEDVELSEGMCDISYFNPPYLPEGSEVRDKWKNAPVEAMFVPGSDDGLDHYRWFIPRTDRFMIGDGNTFIRTPRDFQSYITIHDIVTDHHNPTNVRPIFVQSPQDSREGKTIAISKSLAQEPGPLFVQVEDMATEIYSAMLQFENRKTA